MVTTLRLSQLYQMDFGNLITHCIFQQIEAESNYFLQPSPAEVTWFLVLLMSSFLAYLQHLILI
jgi:hypothetical protein